MGTASSASYLDQHFEFENDGLLRTKLYDKRDDLNFPIVNFPFICSNIPAAEPRVTSGQVEVITSKVLRSLP
jgi:hypothetical protein